MRATLLVTVALGCASGRRAPAAAFPAATAPPPGSLDDLLARDLAADRAFPWSGARRLTWSDFQGPAPSGAKEGALTAYGLYYAWKCRGEGAFEFRVIAAFRPRQSWVKAVVLNDSAQRRSVLGHEQTHFDLSEVHARRMRQVFAELANPCRQRDADLEARAHRLVDEEKAEQRRYDDETDHGLLAGRQAAWSQEVARRLTALRRFGRA